MRLRVLADSDIERVLDASLRLLEETGADFHHEPALEMLRKAGAKADGIRVRFPRAMVERAMTQAPSKVTLHNSRTGKGDVELEGTKIYFGTGSDCPNFVDPWTGQRNRTTKKNVADAAKALDGLKNLDFCMSLGLVQDVPTLSSDRHQYEAMLLNTGKPVVVTAHDLEGYNDIISMAEAVVGGPQALAERPILAMYTEPISPLRHPLEAVDKLIRSAEAGIPVVYTPAPMAGATAPATLAGTLASGLAESLSGLVLHQLVREGAPFILGGVFTVMDMRTTLFSYGAVEFDLLQAALADVAQYTKIPLFCTAGCSDSPAFDEQATVEATFSILVNALSGGNLIHDVGYIEYGSTGSVEMMVLSNEVIAMAKRFIRGIEVNDDTLAVNVTQSVGPGGHFLEEEHTTRFFRKELTFSDLITRQRYDAWKAGGGKTLGQRVHERAVEVLEGHRVEPLPASALKHIRAIVDAADARA
jgi:trimethylamine--corrinoid protein Co-methyltransferase